MTDIEVMKRRRAYTKGTITTILGRLDRQSQPTSVEPPISESLVITLIADVEEKLKSIDDFNEAICLLLEDAEMQNEISRNFNYTFEIKTKLSKYRESLSSGVPPKVIKTNEAAATVNLPLPKITLDSFENNLKNPFAYYTFKKTFLNAIAGIPNLTDAQRLIYLKNFVKGEALNVIDGITVDDFGYKAALDLLDFNFLNVGEIVDKTLDFILALNEVKSLREVEPLIRTVNSK